MAIKGQKGKRDPREKKKLRLRKKITGTDQRPRLTVFRSSKHIYAQLISDQSAKTIACASTLDPEVVKEIDAVLADLAKEAEGKSKKGKEKEEGPKTVPARARSSKSIAAARAVGIVIGRRAIERSLKTVVFDRNGFLYHGRVEAVAEGARRAGLDF